MMWQAKYPAKSRNESQKPLALQVMNDTNWIFKDGNMMALTGAEGQQILRTDDEPLVNVTKREHYRQSMQGRDYASNLINSMSTGEDIIVLEVPVKNTDYKVIGMLQRNFKTTAYQEFVSSLSDDDISIMMFDREGNLIAYTNKELLNSTDENEFTVPYQIISQAMSGVFGVTRGEINGVDSLIGYKKNSLTDWPIIIVYPYRMIYQQVNDEIGKLAVLGVILLFMVSIAAYNFAGRASKPIQNVLHKAKRISTYSKNEKIKAKNVKAATNDELEEIETLLDAIRSERDNYKLETERDTLTNLYTKDSVKSIFDKKVAKYGGHIDKAFDAMAFYLIDLDHFKNLNTEFGHLYGDRVLLEFSQRLRKCFRPLDCVGRLKSNEFIVIADQISDVAGVLRKAEHINKIARSLELDGQAVEVTASIGIAFFPQNGNSYEEVLEKADRALSKAKSEGRDRYILGTEEI